MRTYVPTLEGLEERRAPASLGAAIQTLQGAPSLAPLPAPSLAAGSAATAADVADSVAMGLPEHGLERAAPVVDEAVSAEQVDLLGLMLLDSERGPGHG